LGKPLLFSQKLYFICLFAVSTPISLDFRKKENVQNKEYILIDAIDDLERSITLDTKTAEKIGFNEASQVLAEAKRRIESVIIGKAEAVELALTAFLARGHVLVEDLPGTGKTTLAKT
jgi:hypothetical protein